MKINSPQFNLMQRACMKASKVLIRDFGEIEKLQVSEKSPGDFVTASDKRVEKIIIGELQKSEYSILSEEAGLIKGKDNDKKWIIDPIDGTFNFLNGLPHFAISIGYEDNGEIICGIIFDPIKNEMLAAHKGSGAYLNNSRGFYDYDYVLIDCPPSLSLLTVMALVSSNSLLVPLQTEFFALEGLTQLMKTIERIKVNLNPSLEIQGILLTMYDRRNKLSSQVEQEARGYFKEKVYQTVIPRNVRLSEAPSHGVPVLIYDKNCPGSKSYYSFTDEFIAQENKIGSAA